MKEESETYAKKAKLADVSSSDGNEVMEVDSSTSVEHQQTNLLFLKFSSVTTLVPAFKCPTIINGQIVTLSSTEMLGKWSVLVFHASDFTELAAQDILAFSSCISEFETLNTTVWAISIDSEFTHLAFAQQLHSSSALSGKAKIPLLSDFSQKISRDYGVLVKDLGVAARAIFIIDPVQTLQATWMDHGNVPHNVDEVLRWLNLYNKDKMSS
ncbi:thioredoxin-like protein [Jimgerdemannia flammicorona]|uniref:Thioredoxin-like protein n=1 Tax=Jimgerdemannia flammicorona TaxID=994334 RepID=A0A433QG89_9FUNG|nr:thioredoxin-like protein [Jimgerdemannia flammicorona]